MHEPTRDHHLSVTADGKNLIGHSGAVLLRKLADRTGLTRALAAALPTSTTTAWRDRATTLVHLAIAIILGGRNLSEAERLGLHHQPVFGTPASDSTLRRTLAALGRRSPGHDHEGTTGHPPPRMDPAAPAPRRVPPGERRR